jgi:hypothetical protein
MKRFVSKLREATPIGKAYAPKRKWGRSFVQTSGFSLRLSPRHSVAVFVDRRFGEARGLKRMAFLQKPRILARCISTVGFEWTIHCEPLGERKIGIIAYSAVGKAILTGTGMIQDDGAFRAKLAPLYKGITNRCRITRAGPVAKLSSDGEWGVGGEVEGEF